MKMWEDKHDEIPSLDNTEFQEFVSLYVMKRIDNDFNIDAVWDNDFSRAYHGLYG